ncbi:MAG: hypothetical protein ACM358_11485 [Gemmatimonadota bacterium]
MTLRWDVPVAALLGQLIDHPPVSGVSLSTPLVTSFRDVYHDTPDGDLRQRGARYRLRFTTDGTRRVTLWLPDGARFESEEAEARVRALADPARLTTWTELEVTRRARVAQVPVLRLPLCNLIADTITARRAELNTQLWEFALQPRVWGGGIATRSITRKIEALRLRPLGDDVQLQRAQAALEDAEGRALARELRGERALALIAVEHGRLGLCRLGAELRIPVDSGTGETACRAALRRLVGSGEGQVRLLAVVPPAGERAALEVWTVRRIHANTALQWFTPRELLDRVGSPVMRDPTTLAALTVAARSPLIPEWSGAAFEDPAGDVAPEDVARASRVTLSELRTPVLAPDQIDPARAAPEQFLNPELSWMEFNARVLALAEDPRTPPAARLRFLGIFSTNLDYFVATKVGALKQLADLKRAGPSGDGLRPQETLDALAIRLSPLLARQYRLFHALLRGGPESVGVAMVHWPELTPEEQAVARTRFTDTVLPYLSPKALTRAPGHPFPHVADRRMVLLVVLRDRADAPPHYALVEIPEALSRFEVFSAGRRLLPLEDLVRANLQLLYPGRIVVGAHAFRVTRSGDLQLDESSTANFLQAIEEELTRRLLQPVVRIEIESSTPAPLQDLLQREIHFEEGERDGGVGGPPDVYAADELVNLGALRDVSTPLADYPSHPAREPFQPGRSVAEQLDAHDVLVHHPYDSFTASFERFITEAADDPDVQAIKLTLYRPGGGAGGGGGGGAVPPRSRTR